MFFPKKIHYSTCDHDYAQMIIMSLFLKSINSCKRYLPSVLTVTYSKRILFSVFEGPCDFELCSNAQSHYSF
jgi:hypothetical protein